MLLTRSAPQSTWHSLELTAEERALAIARALLEGFDKHYRLFRDICQQAKGRFERADWAAVRQAHADRVAFYDERVREAAERLQCDFGADALPESAWQEIKLRYVGLLTHHRQPELAETFYNSVSTRLLHRAYFHNDNLFVRPAVSTEYLEADPPSYRCYYPSKVGLRQCFRQILADFALRVPFVDLHADLANVLRVLREHFSRPLRLEANHQIQVLGSLFYRNTRTYAIGKIINGSVETPFAIPIVHEEGGGGLCMDAILLDPREIAPLFAFSRAYFMVDMEVPSAYVDFLAGMMPGKPKAELYTSLGLQKHGKTLFYRDFLHHLKHSTDEFVVAPGIKGLVMIVFTLPSYPYVFKVIRDRISPTKNIDHQTVKDKYALVKRHDRVGRMADTLEYAGVAFPAERFSRQLVEELKKEVPSLVEENGRWFVVKHLYIERRMTPLNIFLDRAPDEQIVAVVRDYGNAIKELASVNIFPGDMLFKNFGVTRGGRVVFYDYDEIMHMTEIEFRHMPVARTHEDEMSAEPWYPIGPNDVFPEEFAPFLLSGGKIRESFLTHHADLLTAEYWNSVKAQCADGQVADVFPYPGQARFKSRFAPRA